MRRWRKIKNDLFISALVMASIVVLLPLALIISHLVKMGFQTLSWEFLLSLPVPVGESGGGMMHAIWGTFYLVVLGGLFAIPFGILLGTYLAEFGDGLLGRSLAQALDLFTGVPSIVIGIFAYILVVVPLQQFSALSGGVALGIIMLPVVAKTTEELLRMIPPTIREAALALGFNRTQMIWHILIKGNGAGIFTGVILAISRAAGETAPLIFTAFGNNYFSWQLLRPMASLPVQIYTYAISPFAEWQRQAWAGSLVLVIFVLGLNLLASYWLRRHQ